MSSEMVLLILVVIAGAYMAWNIGANDVANAMGTSVGSGALTLKQAVMIAAVLEFAGAFFFGSHVSETIQKDLVDSFVFQNPMVIVYGMLAALISAGAWLQIASYYGWPVSTTHTIVGAVVGFGAAIGGMEAVYWDKVAFIATSWILSPIFGGIIAFGIFNLLRQRIFYARDPVAAAKKIAPSLVFGVVFILSLILLYKGLNNINLELNFFESITLSFCCGAVGYFVGLLCVRFIKTPVSSAENGDSGLQSAEYAIVEKMFGYLQIMSACLMAFAHGANDVANAIGPLAAAIDILLTGEISAKAIIPTWVLALGGVGIVVGLATWGWRVIETIGKKITELTPTRGFSAEFGAAVTILIASRLGMPISTTHTLVGAVIGVGLARGIEAIDLRTTRHIFISWLFTVPAGAFLTIILFYIINAIF